MSESDETSAPEPEDLNPYAISRVADVVRERGIWP